MTSRKNKEYPYTYLYGYRSNEVDLKVPLPPDSTRYTLHKSYADYDPTYRPPMAACRVKSIPAVPPRPDTTNPDSLLTGIAKRMAYSPPKYDKKMRIKFRRFVKRWLRTNLEPIEENYSFDFEEWLASTNYPDWRKEEIRAAFPTDAYVKGEIDFNKDYFYKLNLFAKEEYYPEYKHFRGIWARSDAAKGIAGPFFRRIEQALFKLPYFIKKVPKQDRPAYINEFMNNNYLRFQGTDYTSFESLFTTDMMDDCEFELYRYMSSRNPKAQLLCRLLFKIIATQNIADNRFFSVRVDAKRMSGEMNTSLGNGFSNLMFLLFAIHHYKLEHSGPIIEGDDALVGLSDRIPDEYYTKMGLNVKLEFVENISEGSFCGLVYDSEELTNIRDPREVLCTTPWVTRKYAFSNDNTYYSLLRSKALSLMFEYPRSPIIFKYGKKIFELLSSYEIVLSSESNYKYELSKNYYEQYMENNFPQGEPGPRTRLLMEKMFQVPVSLQLIIEAEIDSITIDNFDIPSALQLMPDVWISNFSNYAIKSTYQTQKQICFPTRLSYPKIEGDSIIEVVRKKLNSKEKLTYDEFFAFKKEKDLFKKKEMYDIYVSRWKDAIDRIACNKRKIEQRAFENI